LIIVGLDYRHAWTRDATAGRLLIRLQFTFLVTPVWNNMIFPTVQDKLALGSELLLKLLFPIVGQCIFHPDYHVS
jgi:hypothetical protein